MLVRSGVGRVDVDALLAGFRSRLFAARVDAPHLRRRAGHGDARRTRELDGRPARVWGWTYGTLRGHVEQGERTFEVVKWLDTGEVEFATRAFSRPAARNPVIRLGYELLGRPRQRRFVQSSAERTVALVESRLASRPK